MGPVRALARRTFADARVRTISFGLLFLLYPLATVAGYAKAYPTAADRLSFARSFGDNPAVKLFYGTPHSLETLGGYATWRAGGILVLFAAFFGAFAAVRTLRGEEEAGRFEIVISGAITRGGAFAARLTALGATLAILWVVLALGLVAGGLPSAGSAYLALAVLSIAAVYTGAGALTSQLMPSGRGALELAGAVLGLDFLLRVVADTSGLQGLHWLLPLGWMEEMRPFTGAQPAVLLLPVALSAALLLLARFFERRRDVGVGLFAARDTVARPRLWLLGSPTLLALRTEALTLAVWTAGTAAFAVILGILAKSVVTGLTDSLKQQLGKFGGGLQITPTGVLGLYFIFFVLAIALFCCSQLGSMRSEEAEGRLETLFSLAEGRIAWLSGRLALAAAGATLMALVAGLGAAIGATATGTTVSFPRLLEAGLNCLPASALFLGIGALFVAIVPRLGVGASYAFVSAAFVWELVGAILRAPSWLLGLSPFHQIGLVPGQPFRTAPAVAMLAIGAVAACAALIRFRNRDLVGE